MIAREKKNGSPRIYEPKPSIDRRSPNHLVCAFVVLFYVARSTGLCFGRRVSVQLFLGVLDATDSRVADRPTNGGVGVCGTGDLSGVAESTLRLGKRPIETHRSSDGNGPNAGALCPVYHPLRHDGGGFVIRIRECVRLRTRLTSDRPVPDRVGTELFSDFSGQLGEDDSRSGW